jgi:hypothetical protein
MSARLIISPPSVTARPATLWPPAAYRDLEAGAAGEGERDDHVAGRAGPDDHRGAAVDEAVVDGPGLVVARVLW